MTYRLSDARILDTWLVELDAPSNGVVRQDVGVMRIMYDFECLYYGRGHCEQYHLCNWWLEHTQSLHHC
jgi:hypothetical protein